MSPKDGSLFAASAKESSIEGILCDMPFLDTYLKSPTLNSSGARPQNSTCQLPKKRNLRYILPHARMVLLRLQQQGPQFLEILHHRPIYIPLHTPKITFKVILNSWKPPASHMTFQVFTPPESYGSLMAAPRLSLVDSAGPDWRLSLGFRVYRHLRSDFASC